MVARHDCRCSRQESLTREQQRLQNDDILEVIKMREHGETDPDRQRSVPTARIAESPDANPAHVPERRGPTSKKGARSRHSSLSAMP